MKQALEIVHVENNRIEDYMALIKYGKSMDRTYHIAKKEQA